MVEPARPSSAALVVKDAAGHERTLPLTAAGISIGRAPDNGLSFPDDSRVSRHHAQIDGNGGQWTVIDLGSRHGTWVNAERVTTKRSLAPGDVIELGPPPAPAMVFRRLETKAAAPPPSLQPAKMEVDTDSMTILVPDRSLFLNREMLARAGEITLPGIKTDRLAERIRALYQITSALLEVKDPDELCTRLLEMVFDVLPAERGAVLLAGENGELVARSARQRSSKTVKPFAPSRTIAFKVFQENVAVLSLDAQGDGRFAAGGSVAVQAIRGVLSAPISSGGHVFGVAYVDTLLSKGRFSEADLEFLSAACRQAALALEKLGLLNEQKRTFESMVRALAHSIDARDGITAGHSSRTAKYSEAIARILGMDAATCKLIWYAGLLHDYGKIGTREAVLCKPSSLTPEEFEHIKEHPKHTLKILSAINFSAEMVDIPRIASSHHERIDGQGYPFGWKGDAIPFGGRIIAVADFFDALTVKRYYREPMPLDEVVSLVEKGRGTQFDVAVAEAFKLYVDKEYAPAIRKIESRKTQVPKPSLVGDEGLTR